MARASGYERANVLCQAPVPSLGSHPSVAPCLCQSKSRPPTDLIDLCLGFVGIYLPLGIVAVKAVESTTTVLQYTIHVMREGYAKLGLEMLC